jgi:hypothetical protein
VGEGGGMGEGGRGGRGGRTKPIQTRADF